MFDHLEDSGKEAMRLVREEAIAAGSLSISPAHIVLGTLLQNDNLVVDSLRELEIDISALIAFIRTQLPKTKSKDPSQGPPAQLPFTPDAKHSLEEAAAGCFFGATETITVENLFLGAAFSDESGFFEGVLDQGKDTTKAFEAVIHQSKVAAEAQRSSSDKRISNNPAILRLAVIDGINKFCREVLQFEGRAGMPSDALARKMEARRSPSRP